MLRLSRIFLPLGLVAVIVTACLSPNGNRPAPDSSLDMDALMTQAVGTAMAGFVTPTPLPTETPLPTVTMPPRTPPALPPTYSTSVLNRLDTPHTYIADTCQYLQDKWNPENAQPGTIVMVVMLHSINREGVDDPNDITVADFNKMMNALKEQSFEAINATQLADFLDHNAKIPPRSVVLIQDDRHFA